MRNCHDSFFYSANKTVYVIYYGYNWCYGQNRSVYPTTLPSKNKVPSVGCEEELEVYGPSQETANRPTDSGLVERNDIFIQLKIPFPSLLPLFAKTGWCWHTKGVRADDCPIKSETPCGQLVIVCSFVVCLCGRYIYSGKRKTTDTVRGFIAIIGASSVVVIIFVVSTFGIGQLSRWFGKVLFKAKLLFM